MQARIGERDLHMLLYLIEIGIGHPHTIHPSHRAASSFRAPYGH